MYSNCPHKKYFTENKLSAFTRGYFPVPGAKKGAKTVYCTYTGERNPLFSFLEKETKQSYIEVVKDGSRIFCRGTFCRGKVCRKNNLT